MCTVVTHREPGGRSEILAVRDELMSRSFDEPGPWWPDQPSVVGGRDRLAGGSWCVTDVVTGVTALVLNRPERPVGTPSRGGLPLAAVAHREHWTEVVDVGGMASFTLLLIEPDGVSGWEWNGRVLGRRSLEPGLHVATPHGIDPDDPRARRLAPIMATRPWREVVGAERPSADEAAFVVRVDTDHGTYGTVFAQTIDAAPGGLHLASTRTPWEPASWRQREWTVQDGVAREASASA